MDTFTKEKRSAIMRKVRSKDSIAEKVVRGLAHSLGYRFRLHRSDLPGKPDLTFAKRRKVIFVHGCFWHGHSCRSGQKKTKSNVDYWTEKLARNKKRDAINADKLRELGWEVLVVWECETKNLERLKENLHAFLG